MTKSKTFMVTVTMPDEENIDAQNLKASLESHFVTAPEIKFSVTGINRGSDSKDDEKKLRENIDAVVTEMEKRAKRYRERNRNERDFAAASMCDRYSDDLRDILSGDYSGPIYKEEDDD